jgi:hypothetical protein
VKVDFAPAKSCYKDVAGTKNKGGPRDMPRADISLARLEREVVCRGSLGSGMADAEPLHATYSLARAIDLF